ncbi:SgcJ/EcaC family oxidoreductase [Sphingomonas sp. CGMCC 1.13654]|uniref:SgcJ/EcaC family oxidoreductase n=1 Tax=Sphingomonas chungangi TaxID=2683589 RepID=A0A838LBQ4_9SPHN|nr:SgcJ/EcaC family oxidoreductase [Sphingomonas chungangi]MBA2936290.1 SgcJ/EcaC family oxidoreductase [Sphingomonas chungangi]MVW55675.1 SgcJ/EcaC family oxidoreductase [Sphingomonas chungangi]
MKRWAIIGALLATASAQAQSPDETAIRGIEAQQEASWNAHDIVAWTQPYAPDAQFVTAFGLWWKSHDEIQRKMGWAYTNLFAQSRIHADQIEVTSVTPDVATVHIAWTLDGAKGPDGGDVGTVHLIQSQTLRKAGGQWQIVSAQDTAVISQLPTAAQPVAAAPPAPPAKPKHCFLARANGDCVIEKK